MLCYRQRQRQGNHSRYLTVSEQPSHQEINDSNGRTSNSKKMTHMWSDIPSTGEYSRSCSLVVDAVVVHVTRNEHANLF